MSTGADRGLGGAHDTLCELFESWCRTTAYDTTLKLDRWRREPDLELWGLDPGDVAHAAAIGLGATCIPLAAAFTAAARDNGLDAVTHGARYIYQHGDRNGPGPVDHTAVVVTIENTRWLCDPTFLHCEPVPIITDGTPRTGGPKWAPLTVTAGANGASVEYAVLRGTRPGTQRYLLDGTLTDGELRELYEHVGRFTSGLESFRRGIVNDTAVAVSVEEIVTRTDSGTTVSPLDYDHLENQVGDATGLGGISLTLLCDQIRATGAPH